MACWRWLSSNQLYRIYPYPPGHAVEALAAETATAVAIRQVSQFLSSAQIQILCCWRRMPGGSVSSSRYCPAAELPRSDPTLRCVSGPTLLLVSPNRSRRRRSTTRARANPARARGRRKPGLKAAVRPRRTVSTVSDRAARYRPARPQSQPCGALRPAHVEPFGDDTTIAFEHQLALQLLLELVGEIEQETPIREVGRTPRDGGDGFHEVHGDVAIAAAGARNRIEGHMCHRLQAHRFGDDAQPAGLSKR